MGLSTLTWRNAAWGLSETFNYLVLYIPATLILTICHQNFLYSFNGTLLRPCSNQRLSTFPSTTKRERFKAATLENSLSVHWSRYLYKTISTFQEFSSRKKYKQ
ncbi:hypothetical protein L2E82_39871 [Cichorium intybus]|uniref:Uncharacterized protein n=1 Tax=Cichorium intybus TaxID=13427 RepID=A0ACB9AJR1_CICIN|nr:hypothetical protein L2E82_39871 [Cichorium intybus]